MKKILKWIGIVLGGLLGLLLLAVLGLYAKTRIQFSKTYDVQVESIVIPTGAESIQHGKHLTVILCRECHSDDLGGTPNWLVIPNIGVISPPNITSRQGSVITNFTDEDWIRVLRYGVKPDGKSVFVMRSMDYQYLSDEDLGDILAYVKSAPPVDRDENLDGNYHLTFLGNVAYGAGAFGDLLAAGRINHENLPSSFPASGVTSEYGKYLVDINGCGSCHGAQLAGGQPSDPNSVLAPNLTPGGELIAWTDADFIQAMRTGIALSGHQLNPKFMPWKYEGKMTNDELKAIFMYLQSLPGLPTSTERAE
jgi:mono/diheme cytochrome c family protein